MIILAPISSVCALAFAAYLAMKVMKLEEGTAEMSKISLAVRMGSDAYLKRQYLSVGIFFCVMFVVLLVLAWLGFITIFVPFAFVTGGFFSGLSGYIGMKVATHANVRTTNACITSLNSGLRVAFNSGTVIGLVVVSLGLLDVSFWYYLLNWYYTSVQPAASDALRIQSITSAMLTFGMGASTMALFARVGGGIFTKAADVGADLVGKIEAGIPEDDPRNPAVIADNVGDNVGDIAGMGSDLYESYVGSIIASAALATAAGLGESGVALPIAIASVGVLASMFGTFLVRTGENADQSKLLSALRSGVYSSSLIIAVASYFLIRATLGAGSLGVYFSVLIGLVAGNFIGFATEYFTSDAYNPVRELAQTSTTGAATVIIGGLSLGMLSTAMPVIIVAIVVISSFLLSGGANNYSLGLYGVAISAVGMLSTLGITLATDAYGPIADNAGGIAEMADLPDEVREKTDALDALGNTTAATGKGFAIGSAALTALALIAAYKEEIELIALRKNIDFNFDLSILNPPVLIGMFVGGMLPFVFSSMTMKAVGRTAQSIVVEVRRQFNEIKGLMEGTAEPDYKRCVDICTQNAQKEIVLPAVIAIASPIIVGLLLGVNAVAGMLCGATVSGFMMAEMMSNAGGAWDNAKKHIEAGKGNLGGKGSDNHKAAVVGDTVGDPFKDTSGPSIDILIKLLSMVSIVFASLTLQLALMK
ncbi:MAG: sodium-translocating pyrophosphatase [Eubacteriaceae bacterium]|nr:sodium-translocating pyrophosphatase [Eubacteriaceae bacterium]